MITLHHLENSRSQRVLWLLEELGVTYEVKRYARDKKTMLAPASLRQVHPLGKSPVVTDAQVTVAESGAINEYLLENYDPKHGLSPGAPGEARRQFRFWLHFAEGSAMPPLLMKLVFETVRKKAPMLVRPIASAIASQVEKQFYGPNIRDQLDFMESHLKTNRWFAGDDFSAADIQMSFPVEAAAARGGLGASRPKLAAWLQAIHARPAYRRALEVGGPYSLLG